MKLILLLIVALIVGCNLNTNDKDFPDKIGKYEIKYVVKGDSALREINTLHHMDVTSDNSTIVRYGDNYEDILYITEFEEIAKAQEVFENMISKMQGNKNIPFTSPIQMKNYKNSYMSIGLGSVHYIYTSSKYLIWYSTKQKFYNKLPNELIENYPVN